MRLIDADALQQERMDIDGFTAVTERDIDAAPTIDAIPVEWLEKQADYARSEWDFDTCEAIRIVLKAWEKEQRGGGEVG